jgi:hypothetical protein
MSKNPVANQILDCLSKNPGNFQKCTPDNYVFPSKGDCRSALQDVPFNSAYTCKSSDASYIKPLIDNYNPGAQELLNQGYQQVPNGNYCKVMQYGDYPMLQVNCVPPPPKVQRDVAFDPYKIIPY